MSYRLSQSLISGHPPLLVFTICLTAFGLTMVILAYVVGEQDIPNPDVKMDWNKFLKKLSSFKVCPLQNETRSLLNGPQISLLNADGILNASVHIVDESKSISAMLSNVVNSASDEKIDYVQISAKVHFKLFGKIHSTPFFQVKGKIKGSLLGFKGKYAPLLFNVSLNFVLPLNSSCTSESCSSSLWEVCLTMNLPSDLLYEIKNPDRCDVKDITLPDNSSPVFYIDASSSEKDFPAAPCLALDYTPNSKLTEMLSVHERSIVNLHLMHTSYFMFVMVMTLVCYSLIKGRYRFPKNSYPLEKVPLDA